LSGGVQAFKRAAGRPGSPGVALIHNSFRTRPLLARLGTKREYIETGYVCLDAYHIARGLNWLGHCLNLKVARRFECPLYSDKIKSCLFSEIRSVWAIAVTREVVRINVSFLLQNRRRFGSDICIHVIVKRAYTVRCVPYR
jgi:hypothetical protein